MGLPALAGCLRPRGCRLPGVEPRSRAEADRDRQRLDREGRTRRVSQRGGAVDHRPTREALALLLPDVSYTLLPATNGFPTLLVFRSISSSATLTVAPDEKAGDQAERSLTKARELIVRLKPGAKLDIRQLARLLGAKVTGSIDKLGAYRLEFEDDLKVARAGRSWPATKTSSRSKQIDP